MSYFHHFDSGVQQNVFLFHDEEQGYSYRDKLAFIQVYLC